jgi:transcription initiation factor IIE alpha subunit
MDKNWFISQYNEIHSNLSDLEKEIERQTKSRMQLLSDDSILENLKNKVNLEIDRLNKTREYERKLFGYGADKK